MVVVGDGKKELTVSGVEAVVVDFEEGEGLVDGVGGDGWVFVDLGEVADAFKEFVGNAGGASGAGGDGVGGLGVDVEVEDLGAAGDDAGEVFGGVVFEFVDGTEAVAEGGGDEAGLGGGADNGEFGKVEFEGAGGGAFADDDV